MLTGWSCRGCSLDQTKWRWPLHPAPRHPRSTVVASQEPSARSMAIYGSRCQLSGHLVTGLAAATAGPRLPVDARLGVDGVARPLPPPAQATT